MFCFVVIDVTCAPEAHTEVQLSFIYFLLELIKEGS